MNKTQQKRRFTTAQKEQLNDILGESVQYMTLSTYQKAIDSIGGALFPVDKTPSYDQEFLDHIHTTAANYVPVHYKDGIWHIGNGFNFSIIDVGNRPKCKTCLEEWIDGILGEIQTSEQFQAAHGPIFDQNRMIGCDICT